MSRLYSHLAEIVETADGGYNMTRKGRQYFSRFLRQHGRTLQSVKTHAALIEVLRECNDADFAVVRQRGRITPALDECGVIGGVGTEPQQRRVA